MRNQVRGLMTRLAANYWFLPLLLVAAALAASAMTLYADQHIDFLPLGMSFPSRESINALLSTLAGSTITTLGLVFSLTMVVLTLRSQQYGPLVVYNFLRDRGSQITMGIFLATFVLCLRTLATVDIASTTQNPPVLTVTMTVLAAIASVFVLIYFINHVAASLRPDRVIADLAEFIGHPETYFPSRVGHDPPDPGISLPADFDQNAHHLHSHATGYIQFVDESALLAIASAQHALIKLRMRPGMYTIEGSEVGRVYFYAGSGDLEAVHEQVRAALFISDFRTQEQDIELVFNQIVMVAVRALSPAINDPYTAVMCLNRIADGLTQVAQYTMPDPRRCDAEGTLRLIANPVRFQQLIHLAFDQIYHYGKNDLNVVVQVLRALQLIGEALTGDTQKPLLIYAQEIQMRALTIHTTDYARRLINDSYDAAERALTD